MEFKFPKYPFIWNYDDMYNLIEYSSNLIEEDKYDSNTKLLLEKFPKFQVIKSLQNINSHEYIKNINIHTWYLSQLNVFESDEKNISIITNSNLKYKNNVNVFIFDPTDIFDNFEFVKEKQKQKQNIAIIKNYNSIIFNLIPKLFYSYT